MAQDIRHITEGFDFSSADKGKKKLNAFSIINYFINTPLNNLTIEDKILIRSVGKLPEKYHKVYDLNDLRQLICKSLNVFGSRCDLNWIDVSNITTMTSLFRSTNFDGDISKWDVSNVTSMNCMFYDTHFYGDISKWDVSNVKDMRAMFAFSLFNNDISKWDVSNVKDMGAMFRHAYFNKNISAWNVGNVITMKGMFEGAKFCGDISKWNVSNVKDMGSMFCQSMFNGDISKWDVGNVFDMSYMFSESIFNGDISSWNVSNVSDMESMFSKSKFTGNIGKWDVSNVHNMSYMFFQSMFNGDINGWNIKSLRNMNKMFYGARFIKDISKWDITKVQYKEKAFIDSPLAYLGSTMKCRVYEAFDFNTINSKKTGINIYKELSTIKKLINAREHLENYQYELLKNVRGFIKVEDKQELMEIIRYAMEQFGNKCSLNWIDVSHINNMSYLFYTNMNASFNFDYEEFNGDISEWDVSNVTDMSYMFYMSKFNGDISKWDVSNVTDMEGMFNSAQFNGDISKWDVSNVITMSRMFRNSVFTGDISNWDVGNVKDMHNMFIRAIFNGDISKWDVSKVKNMKQMFYKSKFSRNINRWNVNVDTMTHDIFTDCPLEKHPPVWCPIWIKRDICLKEGFEFNNISANKRKLNIYEMITAILQKVENTITDEEWIYLQYINELPDKFYKAKNTDELFRLIGISLKLFGNDCNLNWIDTQNITNMNHLFFEKPYREFNGDISRWDTSNVKNMRAMFSASQFNGNISKWNISKVKNTSWMFYNSKFNGDISKWDVSNVQNMSYMFRQSIFNGDISNWDVSSVTDMGYMFESSEFNGDISKWDVSNAEDMSYMFLNAQFNGDISKWNVSNVTNMEGMFRQAAFNGDISKWDVHNVENMAYMFHLSTFNKDISGWNIGIDTNNRCIFYECSIKEENKPKILRTKMQESFDFNSISNDKSKSVSHAIVKTMENPHNAVIGDYLYRDKNGKYTLREIDVPWGICVIEAKDTPDNKARFMGIKNATCEPLGGHSYASLNQKALCCFGGDQDIFSDYYVDYRNPETSWNGEEISQVIYNAGRIEKKIRGISYDAVNFCKEYDVHRTEKNWMKAPETGWYCPAYSELWKATTNIIMYMKDKNDPRLAELDYIFTGFYICGIWSCSMFRKEGTFAYYIGGHRMDGYKKKIGWQKNNAFVALPFISF